MKRAFYIIATAVLAVVFAGCDNKEPAGPTVNDELAFTLEMDSVDATSAKIKVSHNGTKEDTWFGFATTEPDAMDSVEDLVAELIASGSHISLKKATKNTYSVKDLTPETDYTFIVVGLTETGEIYGFPNSIEFTTARDMSKLVEDKERWKISYERAEYTGNPEVEDLEVGDKVEAITIECADDEIYYFEYVPDYYIKDESGNLLLEDYVDYVANVLIPEYVANGYTYDMFCYLGGGTLYLPRVESGNYYAIIIGMGTENVHTGAYAVQAFEVIEEEATPEYKQWIGTYTLTTSNETPITYTINIDEYDNNFMYAVTGWECGEELEEDNNADGYPDGMDFGTAFGEWVPVFPIYFDKGKLLVEEYIMTALPVTNENNQNIDCYLGFHGYAMNKNAEGKDELTIVLTDEGEVLAVGETTDGGATGTITGQTLSFQEADGSTTEEDCFALSYAAIAQDYSDFFIWNEPAELPFTLTKVSAVPAQKTLSFGKADKNVVRPSAAASRMNFKAQMSQKADKKIRLFSKN